ncbi:Uncharacterised protein [Mycobacteroides abscessus subsp. abscessus]|nr:Uncharacterised protein [Mycobacteroides abscessus subsp. abscessus]
MPGRFPVVQAATGEKIAAKRVHSQDPGHTCIDPASLSVAGRGESVTVVSVVAVHGIQEWCPGVVHQNPSGSPLPMYLRPAASTTAESSVLRVSTTATPECAISKGRPRVGCLLQHAVCLPCAMHGEPNTL